MRHISAGFLKILQGAPLKRQNAKFPKMTNICTFKPSAYIVYGKRFYTTIAVFTNRNWTKSIKITTLKTFCRTIVFSGKCIVVYGHGIRPGFGVHRLDLRKVLLAPRTTFQPRAQLNRNGQPDSKDFAEFIQRSE